MTTYHTTGTVSVTNGSTAVTGAGTDWATALITAGVIYIAGAAYPIASVASNTALTLAMPYAGATGAGKAYAIDRASVVAEQTVTNAAKLAALLEILPTFSEFSETLFESANASTMLTALNVSAYIQTLLPAASDAAARATLKVRETLTGNRTYYVRTDGSDANDGLTNSAAGAFLTIQKAIDTAYGLDFGIYNVTIRVADGTYTAGATLAGPWVGRGSLYLTGNAAIPQNVVINSPSVCINKPSIITSDFYLDGFKLTSSGNSCISGAQPGTISFKNIDFGSAALRHISLGNGAAVSAIGDYQISGSADSHFFGSGAAYLAVNTRTITFLADVAFSVFARVSQLSGILCNLNTFDLGGFTVTGSRYNVSLNSYIQTGGAGASYLPGDLAGAVGSGGQYS